MIRRSQLFVPGNNEHMIRKAAGLNADSVIIDLEDAVPENEKEAARELLTRLIPELDWRDKELCIRINPLHTKHSYSDILLVSKLDAVNCLVVPKAEIDLSFLYRATGKYIEPLVETAKGLTKLEDIARGEGVVALSYGIGDLAHSLGGTIEAYENNQYVKTLIVVTARAYGIDPVDRVFFNVRDLESFRKDCLAAKAMGFVGKQVIHPNQVIIANEIFTPSHEEIEWAKKVVEAYEASASRGKGAIELNGELIDAVHYRIAKEILRKFNK